MVSSLPEVEDAAQYVRDYWNLGLDPIEMSWMSWSSTGSRSAL